MKPILKHCRILDLPKIEDTRGNLTFLEANRHFPFDIERVYYTYDIPSGVERGGHAHKALHELIISVSGSFDVIIRDGVDTRVEHLNRPNQGLYVCPMVWRELANFSSGSVCLVLASARYEEADYFRNFDEFLAARREGLFLENIP